MKVYGELRHEVVINPIHVVERLIEDEIGWKSWVRESNGKYFKVFNSRGYDIEEEITKDKYEYIAALRTVLNNLKER